ncbi:hypothetical protein ARMGADRAFT_1070472 [Armillaria gallica]|uniref:Uncharacterized protein n=1 Tax=Armillaria gallica TaxID=47427 RepID=A0A2H3EUA9_ARMGA|nr:hypothetical protein ARMGADRAFT_1070472 [Armillaria gallica]
MAGANYMGGKKCVVVFYSFTFPTILDFRNAAKVRSRDAAGRQQKRFFGRQRLNLLSKRRSVNSPTPRNQPQPTISLAHAKQKQNSTLLLAPRGYIPSPSKPGKSKRDGPSSASSSSKVLEALDTSEPMFLRAAMNQILSLPDLAGLSTYKKRKRTSDVSSPGARRSKRVKPEPSPEKDEEGLSFGSQNDQLCDTSDASFRDIYPDLDEDEYDDEELDDAFFQGHLGSHTASSSIQSFPVSALSQKVPHIPMPNDVAQETSSFGTLAVTSSLQTSFSGNIFDYDDPWTAVGVILGLQSAPSTPAKDMDDTSALAEQPRPPTLAHQRRRVRLTAYSSDPSSEGIPVASSHSSDNLPPPPHVDEDDPYSQSDDFHFGEDADNDHDFDDQDTHDVPAHVHQNSSPSLLHLESHSPSAYFSSSNDYFNNLAGKPVADEEGKYVDPLFDRNALLGGSNSDCHSQPVIDGEEEHADEYTFFETSSWAILDADQCVEESIPDNHSAGFPSPDSLHRQDLIATKQPNGVSPRYRSPPSVTAQFNVHKDDLHVAQYASSNASASSSRHSRAHGSPRTSHPLPANTSLFLLDDAQLAALPITIKTNTPSSDSLARGSQVADPKFAVEPAPAPELTHETFSVDNTIHSAYSPAPICRDESAEVIAPQSFVSFSLFSKDDFLEEPDSDD